VKHVTKQLKAVACVLSFVVTAWPAFASTELDAPASFFNIIVSPQLGKITQSFSPSSPEPRRAHPDFILLQNVHCNKSVQYAISDILKQLKSQGLLPARIAVEGAVGLINIAALQGGLDDQARREMADSLVSTGELTGALHFVLSEGQGELYGVEAADLYETSVKMFRRSYQSRIQLSGKLDKLDAALSLLMPEPDISTNASELSQDVRVIRQLLDQHLTPEEVSQVMNRAVISVDHLKGVLPGRLDKSILEPVSASVDFYALALLRDNALFLHSLELHKRDHQETTVIVTGGFHTAGLTKRLRERSYSYVVITPRVTTHTKADERLYVERILGHRLPLDVAETDPDTVLALEKAQVGWLAAGLRKKLTAMEFSSPPIRDIFTAMDLPWLEPSVKLALINQRAQILVPAVTSTKNPQVAQIF